jgi:hypothetical protein
LPIWVIREVWRSTGAPQDLFRDPLIFCEVLSHIALHQSSPCLARNHRAPLARSGLAVVTAFTPVS